MTDPEALDPGDLNEEPSDQDPPEADQLNQDHDTDLDSVEEGEDDGTEDYSEAEDDEDDEDPPVEEDDGE